MVWAWILPAALSPATNRSLRLFERYRNRYRVSIWLPSGQKVYPSHHRNRSVECCTGDGKMGSVSMLVVPLSLSCMFIIAAAVVGFVPFNVYAVQACMVRSGFTGTLAALAQFSMNISLCPAELLIIGGLVKSLVPSESACHQDVLLCQTGWVTASVKSLYPALPKHIHRAVSLSTQRYQGSLLAVRVRSPGQDQNRPNRCNAGDVNIIRRIPHPRRNSAGRTGRQFVWPR